MAAFVIVQTTVDSEARAAELAGKIVEERWAACVQRMPVRSVYRWKGAVESAEEWLLAAKTRSSLASGLTAFIRQNHPYEVPEILVTPIEGGHSAYLDWLIAETRSPRTDPP